MGEWSLDPLPLLSGAVALGLFAQGFSRLHRRRPALAPLRAAFLFTAGVLVAVGAVVSPLDALGEDRLLSAHMLQHLLLGDVAPLLLVLGASGPLALFLLPPRLLRPLGRSTPLRRGLSLLLRPRVTLAVWALAVAAWHVPWAYDAAVASPPLHALEHASFLVAGLLVWIQILDPLGHGRLSAGARAAFAACVLVLGMGLSEALLVAGPLYPHYEGIVNRPFGLSAAEDQRRAGLLMMGEQLATLGTAAALLVWTHVERVQQEIARATSSPPTARRTPRPPGSARA